jgi:hypothetical protein
MLSATIVPWPPLSKLRQHGHVASGRPPIGESVWPMNSAGGQRSAERCHWRRPGDVANSWRAGENRVGERVCVQVSGVAMLRMSQDTAHRLLSGLFALIGLTSS